MKDERRKSQRIKTRVRVTDREFTFLKKIKALSIKEGLYHRERARDFNLLSSLERVGGSEQVFKAR